MTLGTAEGRPVAAIDAGSNTIHLVVARPDSGKQDLRALVDDAEMVRLGADVTAIGAIGPQRTQRAISAIRRQLALAREHGATTVLGIATEGVRRAANASAFLERVRAETGLNFTLISGEQEASLAYWGSTSESPEHSGARGVIEMGGGSLELIVGAGDATRWRASLPLGSGAVRARYLP
ncbi:MAG: Ppx/GppA phosphatase family protein, partial [Ktedonobacterales bacterium]